MVDSGKHNLVLEQLLLEHIPPRTLEPQTTDAYPSSYFQFSAVYVAEET